MKLVFLMVTAPKIKSIKFIEMLALDPGQSFRAVSGKNEATH